MVLYYYCDQAVGLMGGLGVGPCDSGWEPRIAEHDYQSFLGFCVFVSLSEMEVASLERRIRCNTAYEIQKRTLTIQKQN